MHEILAEIVKHEKFIKINTKCGYNENSIKTFNISDLRRSVDSSLVKFGKINILFLHNPRNEVKDWRRVIKVLNEYKKNNLINGFVLILISSRNPIIKKIIDRLIIEKK